MDKSQYVKPVIGIVGGVGAGKSTVAAELVALGCVRIDGDAIGHELLARADIREALRQRWGEAIFEPASSGQPARVNRRALAAVVFADPSELAALNAVLHPAIRNEIVLRIAQAQSRPDVVAVVLDAAVMMEAGWDDLCTVLVYVEADADARCARAVRERGWDANAWESREKSQIPLDTKASRCQYTVVNRSSVSCLREQVRELFRRITHADRS